MNRHEIDLVSLVFGVALLVVFLTWLVAKTIEISWLSVGWVFAGGLVLMGLLGVYSALRPRGAPHSSVESK
jgi:hypothetical protein